MNNLTRGMDAKNRGIMDYIRTQVQATGEVPKGYEGFLTNTLRDAELSGYEWWKELQQRTPTQQQPQAPVADQQQDQQLAPAAQTSAPSPKSVTSGWRRNAAGYWINPAFPNQQFDKEGQPVQ